MEFRVLGPVEVVRDGQQLPLGGPKPRALLAMLLLQRNRAMPRDQLVEGLWGEAPPAGAGHSLDDYVSRLRKLLGRERLARRAPGYLLEVAAGELDLDRFEQLVEEARGCADAARVVALYSEALALWRGPPLADVVNEPFAAAEAARLEEQRLGALEERIEAELALGRRGELVGELEWLVGMHPLRERIVGQLMLAHYGAGRQAAALDVFRALRRRLIAELGLEPSPQLRELERRIMAQDPALAPKKRRLQRARRPVGRRRAALGAGVAAVLAAAATVLLGTAHTPARRVTATSDQLVVLDSTGRSTAQTALPGAPQAIAVDAGSIWLAEPDLASVVRVGTRLQQIVDTVPLPGSPAALTVAGGSLWVADVQGSALIRIDPRTERVVQRVGLGGASAAALAIGGGDLWVADPTDGALLRYNPLSSLNPQLGLSS